MLSALVFIPSEQDGVQMELPVDEQGSLAGSPLQHSPGALPALSTAPACKG